MLRLQLFDELSILRYTVVQYTVRSRHIIGSAKSTRTCLITLIIGE